MYMPIFSWNPFANRGSPVDKEAAQGLLTDTEAGVTGDGQNRPLARSRLASLFTIRHSRRTIITVVFLTIILILCPGVYTSYTWRQLIEPDMPPSHYENAADAPLHFTPQPDSCFVSVLDAYRDDLQRIRSSTSQEYLHTPSLPHLQELDDRGHINFGHAHPIPELLARGESQWVSLLEKQSKNLTAARAEYTRRYGRSPPARFDTWFQFAQERGVLLIDEYDPIESTLAPLRALGRKALRERVEVAKQISQLYTLRIENGTISRPPAVANGQSWREEALVNILNHVRHLLPNLDMVVNGFDEPILYVPYRRLQQLEQNPNASIIKPADDKGFVRLSQMCSPSSSLAQTPQGFELTPPVSLVYDPVAAGDMCKNPYLEHIHGTFIQPHDATTRPRAYTELLPIFSISPTSLNSDILLPGTDQLGFNKGYDPEWEQKSGSRLYWRGSTTGMPWLDDQVDWRNSHRFRLHAFAHNQSTDMESMLVPDLEGEPNSILGYRKEYSPRKEIGEFLFDMSFAGDPIQVDSDTKVKILEEYPPTESVPMDESNGYKFVFDIDGNGWSGRFRRLMSTNSMVIKTTIFSEWFQPRLVPWFMYVPSRMDFTDLTAIMSFFKGSPKNPEVAFDSTAKAIATNGKCFVERLFRHEDIHVFVLRLLLEYADMVYGDGEEEL